jgi:hypothetical protein
LGGPERRTGRRAGRARTVQHIPGL